MFLDGEGYVSDPKDRVDCLNPPVILFPAEAWFYELPSITAKMLDCYPVLSQLLTSLTLKWLTLGKDWENLYVHGAVLMEYIYEYLHDVKKPGFEKMLPGDIRGFHSDVVMIGTQESFRWVLGHARNTIRLK